MTNYILRQTRESLAAKPSLLDEIVASYQGSEAFKILDRAERDKTKRMISVDYTGTLEELQKELKRFPEVKVYAEKKWGMPEPPRVGIVKPVVPPPAPSPRRKRR